MSTNLKANLSLLKRPDGSCEFYIGKTRVLCAVNGPGDIQSSKRKFDKINILFNINKLTLNKNIDISKQTNSGGNKALKCPVALLSSIFIESVVTTSIDVTAYPRTGLQICTQEIFVDGAVESALINGICLALIDAGIRLKYIFVAVTVAKLKDETFVIEPNANELTQAVAVFLFVFKPSLTAIGGGSLIANDSHGQFLISDFNTALSKGKEKCLSIFDFYRQKIHDKFAPLILKLS